MLRVSWAHLHALTSKLMINHFANRPPQTQTNLFKLHAEDWSCDESEIHQALHSSHNVSLWGLNAVPPSENPSGVHAGQLRPAPACFSWLFVCHIITDGQIQSKNPLSCHSSWLGRKDNITEVGCEFRETKMHRVLSTLDKTRSSNCDPV